MGKIVPGWRMKATIAVDHRISDGVEAAKFMQSLAVYPGSTPEIGALD